MVERPRDDRRWRIGTDAEVTWIKRGTSTGKTTTGAIPPVFEAYATVVFLETVVAVRMFSQGAGWSQRLADGTDFHTTDGEDWTPATPPIPDRVLAVAYLDARSAIALTAPQDPVGAVVVQTWTTDDGGTSWARQGTLLLGALTDQVEGMVFDNPSDGWVSIDEAASGFHGMVVYHTASGGDQWVEVARTTNG